MALDRRRRAALSFEPDPRRTLGYRAARALFCTIVWPWFRPRVTGRDQIPRQGAVILAPVHRSFADFAFSAFVTKRKLFFMAKDDLWSHRALGRLLVSLGAFPVDRSGADREALRRAQAVLDAGQVLVLFPEGTRKSGPEIGPLLEGAAFLAARTGAPIVAVGIGGSELAMPKGRLVPRPMRVRVVVGDRVEPPSANGRVARSAIHATTERLRQALQAAYDDSLA